MLRNNVLSTEPSRLSGNLRLNMLFFWPFKKGHQLWSTGGHAHGEDVNTFFKICQHFFIFANIFWNFFYFLGPKHFFLLLILCYSSLFR